MEEDMAVENMVVTAPAEEAECSFTAYEIDLDYEFDAARFFDFTQAESPLEARRAEVWFDSVGSYPPSPFVLKLLPKDEILKENIQISPKSKGVEDMNLNLLQNDSDIYVDEENSSMSMKGEGLTLHNRMGNRPDSKPQTKFCMKSSFPRTSTLMKPTASHLAKQNLWSIFEKTSNSSTSMNGLENQAAKRQKLEGGLLRKVEGASQLQQNTFIHKVPKRVGLVDRIISYTKSKIAISREPDLETAHRAQRTRLRPKCTREAENVASAVGRFKALPLNRKVLEAPTWIPKRSTPCVPNFQEFHLKTSERALQHSSAVSNSSIPCDQSDKVLHSSGCGNIESSRVNTSSTDSESSHTFKALGLNKKILKSKGDVGVFRNSKKETTVPMEFNFHSGRKPHHNPPIELFSNLSLACDAQRTTNFESKFLQSISLSQKGNKENRWHCSLQVNEINNRHC